MSAVSRTSAVICLRMATARRVDRRYSFVIEGFGLITPSITARTFHIGAVTAEQHAHMHFVSFGFEPAEKSTHAVPTIVLVVVVGVAFAAFPRGNDRLLSIDDEILVGFGQFLERPVDVDFLARTSAE